jgi:hypothetical protein
VKKNYAKTRETLLVAHFELAMQKCWEAEDWKAAVLSCIEGPSFSVAHAAGPFSHVIDDTPPKKSDTAALASNLILYTTRHRLTYADL